MKTQRENDTQLGNPYGLTKRQHILSKRSIRRFCGKDESVELFNKSTAKVRRYVPDASVFWAFRKWDQRSEAGYMHNIERKFQAIADDVIAGRSSELLDEQNEVVWRYFALWGLRADYADLQDEDQPLVGISPRPDLTTDKQEHLESRHVLFVDQNGNVPSRQIYGIEIQREIDRMVIDGGHIRWGILTAGVGEFLVPDRPFATMVPISPKCVLLGGIPSGDLDITNVATFNAQVIRGSRDFYFGSVLADCPR